MWWGVCEDKLLSGVLGERGLWAQLGKDLGNQARPGLGLSPCPSGSPCFFSHLLDYFWMLVILEGEPACLAPTIADATIRLLLFSRLSPAQKATMPMVVVGARQVDSPCLLTPLGQCQQPKGSQVGTGSNRGSGMLQDGGWQA